MCSIINIDNHCEFLSVSENFFNSCHLFADDNILDGCYLPNVFYDPIIIKSVDDIINSKFVATDALTTTKILALMHFLDIKLHFDFVIDALIGLLEKNYHLINDDNFYEYIDKIFADSYVLVKILWNKLQKKQNKIFCMFFRLSKFNYASLELNLSTSMFDKKQCLVTQQMLNDAPTNLKEQVIKINADNTKYITSVNMFTNLEELNAFHCDINQKGIQNVTTLRKLDAHCNVNITNVNHMYLLEELHASNGYGDKPTCCGIDQEGIQHVTTLRKLVAYCNDKIKNVNHMCLLEELDASNERCGIDQEGIRNVTTLRKFDAHCNDKIKNVNHMCLLEELDASNERCGIDQEGIRNVTTLRKFDAHCNDKIKNVNHMCLLEELGASHNCGIDQCGIQNMTTLRKFDACVNDKIKNVNHMLLLEELSASHDCGIDQEGIQQLTSLRILEITNNWKITDLNHMINLEELDASIFCDERYNKIGINQAGIQHLISLLKLDVRNNSQITDVNHMINLIELNASEGTCKQEHDRAIGICGIGQDGIQNLTSLRKFYAEKNEKITSANHMIFLTSLDASNGLWN
jgi:hypothetical protein